MKHVLFILLLLPAFSSAAQPTPESALRSLQQEAAGEGSVWSGTREAEAVLRQVYEPRSAAELDAFAAALEEMCLNGTEREFSVALSALRLASYEKGEGTRYAAALDVLIRIYESINDQPGHPKAVETLDAIETAGGKAYIRQIFEASEKPPPCIQSGGSVAVNSDPALLPENVCPNISFWCDAGRVLLLGVDPNPRVEGGVLTITVPYHTDEGPDRVEYYSLCTDGEYAEDGRWSVTKY